MSLEIKQSRTSLLLFQLTWASHCECQRVDYDEAICERDQEHLSSSESCH